MNRFSLPSCRVHFSFSEMLYLRSKRDEPEMEILTLLFLLFNQEFTFYAMLKLSGKSKFRSLT